MPKKKNKKKAAGTTGGEEGTAEAGEEDPGLVDVSGESAATGAEEAAGPGDSAPEPVAAEPAEEEHAAEQPAAAAASDPSPPKPVPSQAQAQRSRSPSPVPAAVTKPVPVLSTPVSMPAAKKPPTPSMTTTPKSFASPAPGRGLNKPWEEVPTVPTDKVNALMLSASAHKWEVVVTVHEPGKPLLSTLSSRVPPKQARLVMTELRTRMRPTINGEDAPTLDAVLVAGMRELAALEEEDMPDLMSPPSASTTKEAVVEVVCHTEFKTQVTYRLKGPLSDMQATALCSAMRRLKNLQKSAVSPHDPVSSTLAAAVIAGLLTWDRDI